MNLLLAEDDAILADALTEQLRHAGFGVEHAPNGAVAEFLLLKQPWDLCILDLGLPMVDGLTVLQRVRQRKPELPVLVLTALDDLQSRVAGLNAGADDYLRARRARRQQLDRGLHPPRAPQAGRLGTEHPHGARPGLPARGHQADLIAPA
jgi:CheY-like chemotaxis protein